MAVAKRPAHRPKSCVCLPEAGGHFAAPQHIASALALGQIPAMRTMLSLLSSSNEMSKFRWAAWLMQANGVGPVETRGPLVNIEIGGQAAGFILDLREKIPPIRCRVLRAW